MKRSVTFSRGFTLIELLVVIAIIAILVAMLLPAVQQVREAARKSQCQDHLHNIGLALHNYEGTFEVFPSDTWSYFPNPADRTQGITRNYSWMTHLLPYIEQKPLYDSINFSAPFYPQTGPDGRRIVSVPIDLYMCPSDEFVEPSLRYETATTNYAGTQGFDWWQRKNTEHEGLFSTLSNIAMSNIKDGTSNTIFVGEVTSNGHKSGGRRCGAGTNRNGGGEAVFRMWGLSHTHMHVQKAAGYGLKNPEDGAIGQSDGEFWRRAPYTFGPIYIAAHCINSEWPGPGSVHDGGAQFLMGDAKVKFFSENIDYHGDHNRSAGAPSIWMSLNTINGRGYDRVGVP